VYAYEAETTTRAVWDTAHSPISKTPLLETQPTPAILHGVVSPDTTPCRYPQIQPFVTPCVKSLWSPYKGLYLGIQPRLGWPE
jgi:hypothetical protein